MIAKANQGGSAVKPFKRRGDGPQVVYDHLLNKIISMRLTAGARIEERVIVEELGISRTPVRQALMRMATEGLIELLPNHGARVPPLDIEEVRSFLEAFEFMLLATGHLAAKRRTEHDLEEIIRQSEAYEVESKANSIKGMIETNEKFHLAIAQAGHNSHMVRLMGNLLTKSLRLDWFWYARPIDSGLKDGIDKSIQEHRLLVQAIRNQNMSEVERITREHIGSFRQPLLEYLSQSDATNFEYA